MLKIRLLIAALSVCILSVAQNGDPKLGNQFFEAQNFTDALEEYKDLVQQEPKNLKYKYRLAVCYLNSNIDKAAAIPLLEEIVKDPKAEANSWYLLGRAYHFAYRFDDAIKTFEKFKSSGKGSPDNVKDADVQIEHCQNAKEIIKFPLNVSFENLGSTVNGSYSDYYPFVTANEEFLVFTTRRDDGASVRKPDGSFYSQVYFSKVKNGKYSKAKGIGEKINTGDGDEEIIGLSADGKFMLFYFDNKDGYGDLFIAQFDGKEVSRVKKLDKTVNSKYTEIAASLSADGQTMYFASDRPGGYGGVDIYSSVRLPNGKWGPAQNLGPIINTERDEDFPNISPDGKYLYFSSKGHTSMGGYDIFKAEFDKVKRNWGDVQNVGYPINTPEDNMNFRVSETGRYGYISAVREGGKGELDIYRVVFNEVEPKYTVLKGYVMNQDSIRVKDVFISVFDNETQETYGDYSPNPRTGRYIIILPPGKFNIVVEGTGYKIVSENVEILDKASYRSEIRKDYILKK